MAQRSRGGVAIVVATTMNTAAASAVITDVARKRRTIAARAPLEDEAASLP